MILPNRVFAPDTNDLFHLLVESAHDFAMIVMNTDRRILRWSAGAEKLLGWSEAEAVGQLADIFFMPEDRAGHIPSQEIVTALQTGVATDERWHVRKDGKRFWGSGMVRPLYDEAGRLQGIGKVMRDETVRHNAQTELQALLARERRITAALQRPLHIDLAALVVPGLAVAAQYEPAWAEEAEVGGDYYDVFALSGDRAALVIADASGKGLEAAARSVQVRDLVRAFTREDGAEPARVLQRLNGFLNDARTYDGSEENGELGGFVCLVLAVFDARARTITVANAGCEPPIVLRDATQNAEPNAQIVEITGLPLGAYPYAQYTSETVQLTPGDVLLMASDGITEARLPRPPRAFFGVEGMVNSAKCALADAAPDNLPTQWTRHLHKATQTILENARSFGGGNLRDDACVLMARCV
jgi:PAS domain S-box-containing protein